MSKQGADLVVSRGAALLDERIRGWRDRIDTDDLDLGNGEWCVLGQLTEGQDKAPQWWAAGFPSAEAFMRDYRCKPEFAEASVCISDYSLGRKRLGLSESEAREHGFQASEIAEYWELDAAWLAVIEAGEPAVPTVVIPAPDRKRAPVSVK